VIARNAIWCPEMCIAVVSLACVSLDARSAPPLATDDAATLEPGACQVEMERRRYGKRIELDLLPACNLFLDVEIAVGKQRFTPDEGSRIENTVYQIKKVLIPIEPSSWGVGISAATVRASGGEPGMRQDLVNALFSRQLAATTLHMNLGYIRDNAATEGIRRTRYAWAAAAEYEATPSWTVVADMFGQRGVPRSSQAGLRWWAVPKYVQLTTSLGAQRSQGRDGRWVSLGLRFETGGPVF